MSNISYSRYQLVIEEIVELWKNRNVQGLQLAKYLWNFSETRDASIGELQQVFIDRGLAPPDPGLISRHITVWGEWVERRGYDPKQLESIGIDRLYLIRKTPLEQADMYLEKARTLTYKELVRFMGQGAPRMSLKLDASLKGIVEETFDYIRGTLREQTRDPELNMTDTQIMEFLCEMANATTPPMLLALWRMFLGEAEAAEYVQARRRLGYGEL